MSKLIVNDEIRFKVSENDYMHHLERAVAGIKDSIIADLTQVIGLVLPEASQSPGSLIPHLRETLGPEPAAPVIKWINTYIEG